MWRQSILNTDCSGHQWTPSSKRFAPGHRYREWLSAAKSTMQGKARSPLQRPSCLKVRPPAPPPQQPLTSKSTRRWCKIRCASTASHRNTELLWKKTIQFKQKPAFGAPSETGSSQWKRSTFSLMVFLRSYVNGEGRRERKNRGWRPK